MNKLLWDFFPFNIILANKFRGDSVSYFEKIYIKTVGRNAMIIADIFLFILDQFIDLFPHHLMIIFVIIYGIIIILFFFGKSDGSVNIISLVLFPQGLIFT